RRDLPAVPTRRSSDLHGIRVNALAPGYIATPLNLEFFASEPGKALIRRIPQRRLGTPADLEGALLLLASDASAYMTGSSIVLDRSEEHTSELQSRENL